MEGSIVNLGKISKPANTLIKKISDAIGVIYEPTQIRRKAKAEADAEKIRAISQMEITELQKRGMRRFIIEEGKKQYNIESITSKALPLLEENSNPENVEDDWITNYFDKCRLISDNEMQNIWSKILAGESNSPGKYSKRTIDLLSSMDKYDAELFSKLCQFSINIGGLTPLVYNSEDNIYTDKELYFSALAHLESIGLVHYDISAGYYRRGFAQKRYIKYFNENIWVEFPKPNDNELLLGQVLLTQVGQQLANVCEPTPVEGFRNYIMEKWKEFGYKVSDYPEDVVSKPTLK